MPFFGQDEPSMNKPRKLKPPPRVVPATEPLSRAPGNEPVTEPGLGPHFDELTRCREAEEAASRATEEADKRCEDIEEEWHRVHDACEVAYDRWYDARAAVVEASAALARARAMPEEP